MSLKRVSFEVAKAIKEAGYPQDGCDEYLNKYGAIDGYLGHNTARPLAMEVWLWLWREKNIRIREEITNVVIYDNSDVGFMARMKNLFDDPEEAIIAAIEYLVDNNLIK